VTETTKPAGTIHDLGYKRYAGTRRGAGTRWRVVARNQLATAWKTWWRYKAPLGLAVVATLAVGAGMFVFSDRIMRNFAGEQAARFADAALPLSIQWYTRAAFLASLSIGARVVAGDVQAGAFTFYFARSVRPRDYVLGKVAGLVALTAPLMFAGPLVLSLARLGLSADTDALVHAAALVPKAIAVGLLGTLVFATVPLAFSSLLANPRYTVGMWAAYYLVVGGMVSGIGAVSKSWIGALDLATALDAVAYDLFDLQLFGGRAGTLDPTIALVVLLAHVAVALAVVGVQVRRLHGHGVGGAT
jgi:ABC-2 type transport system permease protein